MAGERLRARGELESTVLRILWDSAEPLRVREIQEHFPDKQPAITTLLTVLERLRLKGSVVRESDGPQGNRFSASTTESGYAADAMLTALTSVGDRSAALIHFAGDLDDDDVALLRSALDAAARRKP
ncbi:Predicted transcriptional regulator [Plantibacter sp. VKM Ac-1784]|uniref:Predicted transcriptional regulator n=1 Tax=Plantibacter elymi (nom. nud.) TaxID=199708 RepID=A0ABY1RGY3_9MICO|nr:BlaI/MecI/CopY family transcriptional regulator [Plantibacter sp. VKM Ac-1784]SMQ71203.1 Predicted transcriptional regulator [Plantibacter sp. VKM Ac-1784]